VTDAAHETIAVDRPLEGVARITLNRPAKRNAISTPMRAELADALAAHDVDDDVRVTIIRGAGDCFSAGYDLGGGLLDDPPFHTAPGDGQWSRHVSESWFAIWDLAKPVIAQVHGYAIAGATELAQACDLVYVAEDARISYPIVRVASVLADRKRATEWIDRLVKTKVIREINESESINWNHIKTPSPLKDRDFVFRTLITTDAAKKKVVFSYYSVTDPLAPEYDDYVRGSFKSGKFELTMAERTNKDGSKTKGTIVVAEVVVDPKGAVPTFIVNMVQKSWPHKTLTALRKQVAKPDIKDDKRVVDRLTREGFLQ